jgi:hypothetical protein
MISQSTSSAPSQRTTPKGGDMGETIMVILVMPVILALVVVLIQEIRK